MMRREQRRRKRLPTNAFGRGVVPTRKTFESCAVVCVAATVIVTTFLYVVVVDQLDDVAVDGPSRLSSSHVRSHETARRAFESRHPPTDLARLRRVAERVRGAREYPAHPAARTATPYDVLDCPAVPPEGYPHAFRATEVVRNWNPDRPTDRPTEGIYQGLCVFRHETDADKAKAYREAELPFVLRDHPDVLPTVERWNTPGYLDALLGDTPQRAEHSLNNHFMYWRGKNKRDKSWTPPTDMVTITYPEWKQRAEDFDNNNNDNENDDNHQQHWYLRLNSCDGDKKGGLRSRCGRFGSEWVTEEVPWLGPTESFFVVDPSDHRGINCRFGMKGVTAETHFDGSRNFITLLGGERRYLLAHPDQCRNLCLYERGHPSARHTAVDWGAPDLQRHPRFAHAEVNEVVLRAGDSLYLPTYWFHHIVSLNTNYQCNARSGVTDENKDVIRDCGF